MTSVHRMMPPSTPQDQRPRRRQLAGFALIVTLVVVGIFAVSRCQGGDDGTSPGPWTDGSVHGPWRSVFNGHGENAEREGSLVLSPRPARKPEETHAGLIVSTAIYQDLEYLARMRTVRQLRDPRPNPWEVPWLIWAYSDAEHFYYITLKPNGWELGKRDPAYPGGQRFLATGQTAFPIGEWSAVRVEQRADRHTVTVNGRPLATFVDRERPYLTGSVGLYTEDARVEFREVSIGPSATPGPS